MDILVFDICAFAIGLLLLVSAIARRQYKGRTNIILYCLILSVMLAIVGDLINGMISDYGTPSHTMRTLMYVGNYIYFVFHNLIMFIYILYIYSSVDIWHNFKQSSILPKLWVILLLADLAPLLVNFGPVKAFEITEDLNYVRGPLIVVFYIIAGIMIVWSVLIFVRFRKLIHMDKTLISMIMFPVAGLGVVIQLFFPHMLVEMFSIMICGLFLLVLIRREENQVDPITGAIKYNEGIHRVTNSIALKKPITIIFVKIKNNNNLRLYLGQKLYNEFLRICTSSFYEIARETGNSAEIYFMGIGLFGYFVEGDNKDKVYAAAQKTNELFLSEIKVDSFSVMVDARICQVSSPKDVNDFSVLYTLATTFHDTMPDDHKVHLYSDYKYDLDFKIRNEIKEILERGIKNKSFKMYFQPIYSTIKKKYVSAEALIRLTDRVYGAISPAIFIPMAEVEGSIHEIGDFVIEEVIRFVSENNLDKLGLEYIEMNLAASQCIEVDLVDKIKGLLEKYKVDPSNISLEITENAADINPAIVDQNIKALHDFGIRIALDDYGTGYSNIKRVTALPIDQVKLDKSFVDLIDDKQMWIVIQDTIRMLKEMGKEILVEGVENAAVAAKFTELDPDLYLGCELIQGFYFCKPLPQEEFIEFIRNHQ